MFFHSGGRPGLFAVCSSSSLRNINAFAVTHKRVRTWSMRTEKEVRKSATTTNMATETDNLLKSLQLFFIFCMHNTAQRTAGRRKPWGTPLRTLYLDMGVGVVCESRVTESHSRVFSFVVVKWPTSQCNALGYRYVARGQVTEKWQQGHREDCYPCYSTSPFCYRAVASNKVKNRNKYSGLVDLVAD